MVPKYYAILSHKGHEPLSSSIGLNIGPHWRTTGQMKVADFASKGQLLPSLIKYFSGTKNSADLSA